MTTDIPNIVGEYCGESINEIDPAVNHIAIYHRSGV